MSSLQLLLTVAAMAVITFLTRVTPFLLFPGNKTIPKYIEYIGSVLPFAVIGMLIVYCLKSTVIIDFPFGLPETIAITFVIIVHKWKHNLLFSIGGGTVLYMILVQNLF